MIPKIGLLETGRPPEALRGSFADYTEMAADWLGPLGGTTQAYAVLDNAPLPDPSEADLWLITGSRHGVYEDHPWIPPLEGFIRDAKAAGRKMVGICFGHQILAQALGGQVVKSDKGWGLGTHVYDMPPWPDMLASGPGALAMNAVHKDQVLAPPAGAVTLARSDFCHFAALWYPGFGISFQGHPEFSDAYMQALLEHRRGAVWSDAQVDAAVARTRAEPTTRRDLAQWLARHWQSL